MNAVELLIDNPSVNAEQILAAADDPREIFAVADQVLAAVDRAGGAAEAAFAANAAALARSQACSAGTPESAQAVAVLQQAHEKASRAVEDVWAAWDRYQPWKEARQRLQEAMTFLQQIESN